MPESRPKVCIICYDLELVLRPEKSWEGMIPARKDQLIGWFKSMPYWKKKRGDLCEAIRQEPRWQNLWRTLLASAVESVPENNADAERLARENSEKEFTALLIGEANRRLAPRLEAKTEHVLEEVTQHMFHHGSDSMLPADLRFKRTRNDSLYMGAGNILSAIEESAQRLEDNPAKKRWLKSRLWITPGKVVMYRYLEGSGNTRFPIKIPDGRHERNIPPEPPNQRNFFRGKTATLVFAEKVDYPAYLHFFLWSAPEIHEIDLRQWLWVAGERGLGGYRQMRQGQFSVRLQRVTEEIRQLLLQREEAKRRGEPVDDQEVDRFGLVIFG